MARSQNTNKGVKPQSLPKTLPKMISLPGNCRAGLFSISPVNWKSQSAKVNVPWSISYWFYDDTLESKKKIVIKGMNRLTSLREKQDMVKTLIDYEMDLIQTRGWNHITKSFSLVNDSEVSPSTPVLDALQYAFGKLQLESKSDIKSALKFITEAIEALHYDRLRISEIRRRHIKLILEKCGESKARWSNSSYNHYRSYLRMLFKELLEVDAIDTNPINDLSKKKETRTIRLELTKEERALLRRDLPKTNPRFWIFLNIFFHSGSRETEMMRLQLSDVDLAGQRFKVIVKKGKDTRQEWRPIKDIAVPYWQQAVKDGKQSDYIFSEGLQPGPDMIRADQITKRWGRIKKRLGIKADFYSLKHTNLDEIDSALSKHKESIKEASRMAGHTTPIITMTTYAQGHKKRKDDTLKGVRNEF